MQVKRIKQAPTISHGQTASDAWYKTCKVILPFSGIRASVSEQKLFWRADVLLQANVGVCKEDTRHGVWCVSCSVRIVQTLLSWG